MTPCTCHPGNTCTSAASCAAARRVEFGENVKTTPAMPEHSVAIKHLTMAANQFDCAAATTNDHKKAGEYLQESREIRASIAALQAQPAPTEHIKDVYTLADLNERIASNDYNAELLLQHAMLLLNAQPAEVSDAEIDRICYLATEIRFAKTDDAAQAVIDKIRAILALRPQAVPMTGKKARRLSREELAGCCGGCASNSAIETWMRRAIEKFCEVNGITAPAGGEG